MRVVYVRLLLFGVTWAATQEEKSKDNIALHHFGKRRNQEPSSSENIVLESEKGLSILEVNGNNGSSKSPNFSAYRQTLKEEYGVSHKEKAHKDLKVPAYPESTDPGGAKGGENGTRSLHDREGYSAVLIRNKVPCVMRPTTVTEPWGKEKEDKNPTNVSSKILAGVNCAKAHSEGKKSPVKSKSTRHIRRSTRYLPRLSKAQGRPGDVEGSGYPDLQGRGDNDISPFSGDGQPFQDLPGKAEAIGPDLESTDTQTRPGGPGGAEPANADRRGAGDNEIPEGEEGGGQALAAGAGSAKEAGSAAVSLMEGSSDVRGSTNFRDLPGKEGNRADAGSQNAHRGEVERHYPNAPSKGQVKGGGGDARGSAAHSETPKHGNGGARKATEPSGRKQEALGEIHRFSSKGKSWGRIIPSHGLDNEIGSHVGTPYEGNMITHSRKDVYVPNGQNTVRSKGSSQRRGPWGYRKAHSNRRFSSPKRGDSSESSDSGSSSESDGH